MRIKKNVSKQLIKIEKPLYCWLLFPYCLGERNILETVTFQFYFLDSLLVITIEIESMFLGINIFYVLLRAQFNPCLTAWANISLSRWLKVCQIFTVRSWQSWSFERSKSQLRRLFYGGNLTPTNLFEIKFWRLLWIFSEKDHLRITRTAQPRGPASKAYWRMTCKMCTRSTNGLRACYALNNCSPLNDSPPASYQIFSGKGWNSNNWSMVFTFCFCK